MGKRRGRRRGNRRRKTEGGGKRDGKEKIKLRKGKKLRESYIGKGTELRSTSRTHVKLLPMNK